MDNSFKKLLLRSSTLAGALLGTAAVSTAAQAVTVNSSSLVRVEDRGNTCGVVVNYNLTGTTGDSGLRDFYIFGARTSAGPAGLSLGSNDVNLGQTVQTQVSVDIHLFSGRDDYTFSLYDAPAGATTTNTGPIIDSIPLSRSLLVAEGGACAQVAANLTPVANAGPDQNLSVGGGGVNLDATASSDGDNDPLTYAWSQVGGTSTVALSGANSATPTFTAPAQTNQAQSLVFDVTVSDGLETSVDQISVFIVAGPNSPPTVDAGPDQTVTGGSAVNLVGTTNDNDNDPLTVQWTQAGGPGVTLTGATTLNPSFTAPPRNANQQTLTFSLVANDGADPSIPDTVDVIIPANQAPVANAGTAQNVIGGSSVSLDGSASSDPDGDNLIFNWSQTAGPTVVITGGNTANPTFIAPPRTNNVQALQFRLIVTDPFDASNSNTVDISVAANDLPIADAGPDQSLTGNSAVTLDGSGSTDPEGDPISYSWVQTGGPSVTLSNASIVNPTFTAPAGISTDQTLTFRLTVNDTIANGPGSRVAPPSPQQDDVQITILANAPPVADAGPDQGPIDSGQGVTLDGSASSDPDNDALTYSWAQLSGTPVSLTSGNSTFPTFVAPLVNGNEDLVFSLTVNDGQSSSVADTVTISVRAVGTVTIIQRTIGGDTPVTFTSSIVGLNGTVNTANGTAQISANSVSAGSHTISVNDLTGAGFAVTDISCNDSDSVANLSARSIALELSPSEDLVCTFTSTNSREAATTAIADFLTGRNALIMSHQPDLQRRLDRLDRGVPQPGTVTAYGVPVPGSGSLPFAMSLGSNQASASTSLAQAKAAIAPHDRSETPFDIWGEAFFTKARLGDQRANFRIFHIGADYRIGDNLLLGALAEFDDFNDRDDLEAGEAEGSGWLVGPYVMTRLAPSLFAEVRAGWGKSDNRVSPLGTYIDGFETSRSYYSGSLIGQFDIGADTQVRPELTVRYLDETQRAYTDSLSVIIPEQSVDQGDISFRPRLQHVVKLDGGWIMRPFGEVEGIYTFGTNANNVLDNGLRARIEGGLDLISDTGIRASLGAFHDGIGADHFSSSGVHFSLSFGF